MSVMLRTEFRSLFVILVMIVDMVLTKEGSMDKMLVTKMEKVKCWWPWWTWCRRPSGDDVDDEDGEDVDDQVESMLMTKMERMLMTNLDKTDNIAQQSGAPAWHREGEGRWEACKSPSQ